VICDIKINAPWLSLNFDQFSRSLITSGVDHISCSLLQKKTILPEWFTGMIILFNKRNKCVTDFYTCFEIRHRCDKLKLAWNFS